MSQDDWWKGSVTYQIYPRSFMDASGNGVGDIKGIISKLDYVASLGVDAIWLSPVFTSPMRDMGYDVSDYLDIDPLFGTLADFDAMIEKAHALGLKIIVDQVISHASDQHPFFEESRQSRDNPKADWFVWGDANYDGTPPSNWMSIFGGPAWTWDTRRKQYYMHNFLSTQPDWNFHNPEVQDYHLECMEFWLKRGVDGFRLDTVNYYFHDKLLRDNPANHFEWGPDAAKPVDMQYCLFSKSQPENLAFLERLRTLLDKYDARTTVGEVGDNHQSIDLMGQYTSEGRLHMAYSFELLGPDYTPEHFRSRIERFFDGAPDGWPCWAFSNHDVPRHAGRFLPNGKSLDAIAKQSAALLLTFRGSVCLYQGEELGLVDTELEFHELTDVQGIAYWPEPVGRDNNRTPIPWTKDGPNAGFSDANATWLPVKAPAKARAVDQQETKSDSVLNFYRRFLKMRQAHEDLRTGEQRFLDLPEPLLGYERGNGFVCLFNLSKRKATAKLPYAVEAEVAEAATLGKDRVDLDPNGFLVAKRL
ncbi:MAG: alpha-amylase family glycosyl hydrolase [Rhodobacteraceae bacterium]|nr:alpha-amylase family glycosyl hydrolase [Paracoccaceae bacterium]